MLFLFLSSLSFKRIMLFLFLSLSQIKLLELLIGHGFQAPLNALLLFDGLLDHLRQSLLGDFRLFLRNDSLGAQNVIPLGVLHCVLHFEQYSTEAQQQNTYTINAISIILLLDSKTW